MLRQLLHILGDQWAHKKCRWWEFIVIFGWFLSKMMSLNFHRVGKHGHFFLLGLFFQNKGQKLNLLIHLMMPIYIYVICRVGNRACRWESKICRACTLNRDWNIWWAMWQTKLSVCAKWDTRNIWKGQLKNILWWWSHLHFAVDQKAQDFPSKAKQLYKTWKPKWLINL